MQATYQSSGVGTGGRVVTQSTFDSRKFVALLDLSWQDDGLCRHHVDGVTTKDFFFESQYITGSAEQRAAKARVKKVCDECPVEQKCLDYAVENDERCGFWGGKTVNERRKHRQARSVTSP